MAAAAAAATPAVAAALARGLVHRGIGRVVTSVAQTDGENARVRRSIGSVIKSLDPFLLLDEFAVAPPAGFPAHPHRGFQTVTYMINGAFEHRDSTGHHGVIRSGGLQWATAGRGIVHSELPWAGYAGESTGLQLWVNLAAKDKMCAPQYQEIPAAELPKVEKDGAHVTVIAGESLGVQSKVFTQTPTMYLDVVLDAGASLVQPVPSEYNGFVYVLQGACAFGRDATAGREHQTLVMTAGDFLEAKNTSAADKARFVMIAGRPLKEPIVQHGPVVMNTWEEIEQFFEDYRDQKNGFEGSHRPLQ